MAKWASKQRERETEDVLEAKPYAVATQGSNTTTDSSDSSARLLQSMIEGQECHRDKKTEKAK